MSRDREEQYDELFEREKVRLYYLAFGVLGDPGEAQDAVQETLWQVWKHWTTVRAPERRSSWTTAICINTCINARKKLRARGFFSRNDIPPSSAAPADRGLTGDSLDLLRAYMRLSPKQRVATLLTYEYGYTPDECAPLMGCGPGSVRTHIARALRTLRRELDDD